MEDSPATASFGECLGRKYCFIFIILVSYVYPCFNMNIYFKDSEIPWVHGESNTGQGQLFLQWKQCDLHGTA